MEYFLHLIDEVGNMNIFINSPGYYTTMYGVDNDIYRMCDKISKNMDLRKYTEVINTLGITPIISPDLRQTDGVWKQEIRISLNFKMASISINSDFDEYVNADTAGKKQIIIENIKKSAHIVKNKLKEAFDLENFIKDLDSLLEY